MSPEDYALLVRVSEHPKAKQGSDWTHARALIAEAMDMEADQLTDVMMASFFIGFCKEKQRCAEKRRNDAIDELAWRALRDEEAPEIFRTAAWHHVFCGDDGPMKHVIEVCARHIDEKKRRDGGD